MKTRFKHFPAEDLLDFMERKLEPGLQVEIENHLTDCLRCQEESKELIGLTGLMTRDRSFDAPKDSVKWIKNLFPARMPKAKPSAIKKILGILQMDLSQGQAFAERSSASSTRQMLYKADKNTLDIRVIKGDNKNTIAGQILGDDFSGCETQLRQKGKSFFATINDMNEFKFSDIESGKYRMTIKKKGIELILKDLEF